MAGNETNLCGSLESEHSPITATLPANHLFSVLLTSLVISLTSEPAMRFNTERKNSSWAKYIIISNHAFDHKEFRMIFTYV